AAVVFGVSRTQLHEWLARYRVEGAAGLVPRSRRPLSSPAVTAAAVEDEIVRLHKDRNGRWGAKKIRAVLAGQGVAVPAVSTVHQILHRRGLIAARAGRQVRDPGRRFARQFSNDLWQIDGTQHRLVNGSAFWVVDVLDDCSRFLLAAVVGPSLTGALGWQALRAATASSGLPRQLLSDNGVTFTGRSLGIEVFFERQVHAAGIEFLHGRARHPQTQGKIEREHRTQNDWIADHRPHSLAEAQHVLDAYRTDYNTTRPHEALAQRTPAEVHQRGTPAILPPMDVAPADAYPAGAIMRQVSSDGTFRYHNVKLRLEPRWADLPVGLIRDHARLKIYYGHANIVTLIVGDIPHPKR
ncbi:integrase core domain-containing protein, partial [Dactylosporangium siamense]